MIQWFYSLTTAITLATITVALWLGLFLVTRAGRSQRVWLAALTVWTVGFWFLFDVLQASNPSYGGLIWLLWLAQGIKFAPTFWFHLSHDLRVESGALARWQVSLGRVIILLCYALTLFQILDTSRRFGSTLYPEQSPSYVLFLALLIILPPWTMWNFYQARAQMRLPLLRHQLRHLLVATAVAYVGGLYAALGIYLDWNLPRFPSYAIWGTCIILLGYGVVKYDALLEGRSIQRDALYSSVGVGVVTLVYSVVAVSLWTAGAISLSALAIFLICAVITHTLSDGGRTILDRLFYRGHLRQLRTDLRSLAREAGAENTLTDQLYLVLETVCETIGAREGFIAIRRPSDEQLNVIVSNDARWRDRQFATHILEANEPIDLLASQQPARQELQPMAMLVPLADDLTQNGALVLGSKLSGAPYSSEDLDYLETVAHQLAVMIESYMQQEGRVQHLEQVMEEYRERERSLQQQVQQLVVGRVAVPSSPSNIDEETMTTLTEDALRHLHDYAYLGEHELAKLQVVSHYLPVAAGADGAGPKVAVVTYLDQGKALHTLLLRAVEQLRPAGAESPASEVPSREWHHYLILRDSYLQGQLTRDIMARLYIGEGTYNRARRRALRSVAKIIREMERQIQQNGAENGGIDQGGL